MRTPNGQLPFVLLVAMAICINTIGCEQSQNFKESASFSNQNEEQQLAANTLATLNRADGLGTQSGSLRANSRLLAVPLSLARFMFPHSRQTGEQYQLITSNGIGGGGGGSFGVSNSKRSAASQMAAAPGPDILIGSGGLGKRSVPLESMNLEPVFERPALIRGSPTRGYQVKIPMYDLHDVY